MKITVELAGVYISGGFAVVGVGLGAVHAWVGTSDRSWWPACLVVYASAVLGWCVWGPTLIWLSGVQGWPALFLPAAGLAVGSGIGCAVAAFLRPKPRTADDDLDEVTDDDPE